MSGELSGMEPVTNGSSSTADNVTTVLEPAPQFTHTALVKVVVLSVMFLVSLTANSAVLICVIRRWRRRRMGHRVATRPAVLRTCTCTCT